MTLVTSPTFVVSPPPDTNLLSITSHLLSASGHKMCVAFQAPETGSITGASFNTGTVTTGDTLTVNLKDVDTATGFSGSTTRATGSVVVNNTDDNAHIEVTFESGYSATRSEWLSLEIVNGAAGNLNIVAANANFTPWTFPRSAHDSGSGYGFVNRIFYGTINYNGTYYFIQNLIASVGTASVLVTWTSATNDRQIGVKFKMPGPCRIKGIVWFANTLADLKINLWDSDGFTVLATKSIDENELSDLTTSLHSAIFSSPIELDADTWYRVTITPTAATSVGTYYLTVPSVAKMGATIAGANYYGTESNTHPPVEEADWDDFTTRVPSIGLIMDQIDNGVGGGERYG